MKTIKYIVISIILSIIFKSSIYAGIPDSIINQYKHFKNDTLKCNFLINKSYQLKGNNPRLAFNLAEKALFYAEQANYIQGMSKAYNLLGSIKCNFGDYLKATEYHQEAFELAKFLKNDILLAETYTYLGDVAYAQRKFSKAIEYYKESLKLSEKAHAKIQSLNNLYKLGLIYETLDNYTDAYRCYKRSLLIEEELKNPEGKFFSLMGIASIAIKRKNYQNALVIYQNAQKIAEKLNILSYKALIYSKLGELFKAQEKYKEALNYYKMALSIADSLDFIKEKRDCYYNLAQTNEKLKFYKDAFNYMSKVVEINDTLYNTEINDRIARLQLRFELKTREKEIEQLRQKEEQRTRERNYLIVAILLVSIIAILLFTQFKTHKKNAKKIHQHYLEIKEKKDELNTIIEQLNKTNLELKKINDQLTDSLIYASLFQNTIMPFEQQIKHFFNNSFVINLPKHIVSGDFAWIYEKENNIYFAVADCTGHGLAAALISIKAYVLLNNIVQNNDLTPGEILTNLNNTWITFTNNNLSNEDAMEICLCKFNKLSNKLEYSTTNQRMIYVHQNNFYVLNNNQKSIGSHVLYNTENYTFNTNEINISSNDILYLFTDGYYDQYNDHYQKLMFPKFFEKIQHIFLLEMNQQQHELIQFFNYWKGNQQQIDDMLLIGIKF